MKFASSCSLLRTGLFPVCRGELDEIIGVVRAKEMLVALEEGVNVEAVAAASPAIVVPETLDPINLLGVLAPRSR
ncbi:integral membrane protein TerC [Enterobacter asburiae]|uniref:Integral membrane protein TerC n=1 Tax=Enterobacter asburiae TaxID=61645 RepID=A0A376FEI0_ENTAS|nr:integral membrane protein TerC [Enterobacter asburiae]